MSSKFSMLASLCLLCSPLSAAPDNPPERFYYIDQPFAIMREEANAHSWVCSQALYSEQVQIIARQGDWTKIRTPDGYLGWVEDRVLIEKNKLFLTPLDNVVKTNRAIVHLYQVKSIKFGPVKTLPFGVHLKVISELDGSQGEWLLVETLDGSYLYIRRPDIALNTPLSLEASINFIERLVLLPYSWGGKGGNGFDCSGLVQTIYRQAGIDLPRDARDQVQSPLLKPTEIENLKRGDLIFFGPLANCITHVGIYLDQDHFIHATSARDDLPEIRVNHLNWDEDGDYKVRTFRTLVSVTE